MYKKKPKGWLKHIDFILLDVIWLNIAFCIAYIIRHNDGNPYAHPTYRALIVVATLIDLLIIFCFDSYQNVLKRGLYREFLAVMEQTLFIELFLMMYMFITKSGTDYSRITLFLTGVIYAVCSYIIRILWKSILKRSLVRDGKDSLLIITDNAHASESIEHVRKIYGMFHIAGVILTDEDKTGEDIDGIPVVTSVENAAEYVCRAWVDEVFVALPPEKQLEGAILDSLMETGVVVHIKLAEINGTLGRKQVVEKIGDYTVLTTSINYASGRQMIAKRCIDIVFGLVGCILTCIIFLFVAPAIMISSPGPVFFKQERVGKNGKKFQMYKFRSMYLDAEERKKELLSQNRVSDGMMFKLDFDPRIIGNKILPNGKKKTGIGEFIRSTSLDEFPQFFNVLKGDMSLVGTRPPTVDEYNKYQLHHRSRLAVMPGITGMWQVSGRSNITDFEEVVKLDRQYIENWSIGLDIKIILKTVKMVLGRDGAL